MNIGPAETHSSDEKEVWSHIERESLKRKDILSSREDEREITAKKELVNELRSLKQEANSLVLDEEVVEGSIIGTNQVLHALCPN